MIAERHALSATTDSQRPPESLRAVDDRALPGFKASVMLRDDELGMRSEKKEGAGCGLSFIPHSSFRIYHFL
jgi:hypothetical protein